MWPPLLKMLVIGAEEAANRRQEDLIGRNGLMVPYGVCIRDPPLAD